MYELPWDQAGKNITPLTSKKSDSSDILNNLSSCVYLIDYMLTEEFDITESNLHWCHINIKQSDYVAHGTGGN